MATLRTAALSAALLALGLSAGLARLRAAEPCAWRQPAKPARLLLDDRVAVVRRYYDSAWAACAAPNGARVSIEWRAGNDPQAPPIQTGQTELQRRPSDAPNRLEAKLYPNQVCDRRSGPRGKLALTGLPGDERVSELVPVRARVLATGPLAPLAFESPLLEFPCPACTRRGKQRLEVAQDPEGNLALEIELDAGWVDCARQGATLLLLGFGGHSQADVLDAVRPDLVLRDLERQLTRRGNEYVLRKALTRSALCTTGHVWGFEFWGRGELMHAAGGGRIPYVLQCGR